MVSVNKFRQKALSFPETAEQPHFEKTSFRVKKKIFATLDEKQRIATLKFSLVDQSVFCLAQNSAIYPVPNKWGKQGWTFIDLTKVTPALLADALSVSYNSVFKPATKKTNN